MKKIFFLILILKYISSELIYVFQLNRHGARTDKYLHNYSLSKLYGTHRQLTINGYYQLQILGKMFRDKYINKLKFLHSDLNPLELEFYSSEFQRNIFSSESFIQGLYPGTLTKVNYENKNLNNTRNIESVPINDTEFWDITNTNINNFNIYNISINVLSLKNDKILNSFLCNYKGNSIYSLLQKIPQENLYKISNKNENTKNNLKIFANFLGINFKDFDNISDDKILNKLISLFETYYYHYDLNWKNLDINIKKLYKKIIFNRGFSRRFKQSKIYNLIVSGFYDELYKKIKYKLNNINSKLKYSVYTGHDFNFIDILLTLLEKDYIKKIMDDAIQNDDSFNFIFPKFSSYFVFELHKINEKYYIKIYYNGKYINPFVKNKINEENGIQVEKFLNLIKTFIDLEYLNLDCDSKKNKVKKKIDL